MNELSRNFQPDFRPLPASRHGAAGPAPQGAVVIPPQGATVDVMTGAEIARCPRWSRAFAAQRKDHRYFDIVEAGIRQGFDYRYFALRDATGAVRAIAPFFVLDQNLCAGLNGARQALAALRSLWPRFLTARTLMVGCVAGEGHLDGDDEMPHEVQVRLLRDAIPSHAGRLGASLVVFKEFPARYRGVLACLAEDGYTRVPSFPMTRLDIDYPSFEAYMADALSRKTRRDLRLKFRAAAAAAPITLTVTSDITQRIAELYPLYSQVFARSKWRFEKLTPEYFCALGQQMPDRVRYFIWTMDGRAVAFSLCMVAGEDIFAEYLGLDYSCALDLHLYHYAFRDVVRWAMADGYKSFRSSGLNYDPKLHLRSRLDPLDLYVRHCSPLLNKVLAGVLPALEPTHADPVLRRFPNYDEMWA